MKIIATALTALTLFAGAAGATTYYPNDDRPAGTGNVPAAMVISVEAGQLLSNGELNRRGVAADQLIEVTRIPSSGMIDHD